MSTIFTRISVRRFLPQPVEKDKLELLLKAAMAAPSACNQQPWEFYPTNDPGMIQKLSDCSPHAKCLANAPLAIALCYRTEGLISPLYHDIDLSAATENLLLQAAEIGLGTVWLGIAPLPERMLAVREALQLPSGLEAFALVACGYPAPEELRPQQNRYESERIHWQYYQN